jgi:hypothetical protein
MVWVKVARSRKSEMDGAQPRIFLYLFYHDFAKIYV